ncbi:MAG: O-antigen ligase family protein [Flavobacteriales bacterium]|nr:O-antigen ligase family protein [Flavobacteriales bacterium]MCB9198777.1 O-antigen ligase family protein [Flavobacteriales bacterium]
MRYSGLIDPGISIKQLVGLTGILTMNRKFFVITKPLLYYVWIPISFMILWSALGMMFYHKINFWLQASRWVDYSMMALLITVFSNLMKDGHLKVILTYFSVMVTFLVAYVLIEMINAEILVDHANSYRVNGFFEHRNILAMFLSMSFGILSFFEMKFKNQVHKAIHWITFINLILLIFEITLVQSRGAWIVGGILFLTMVVIKLLNSKDRQIKQSVILSLVLIGTIILINSVNKEESTSDLLNTKELSMSERTIYWQKSATMIVDHSFFGVGSFAWPLMAGKDGWEGSMADAGTYFVTHPHNDFLLIASENGIPTLIAFIVLLLGCFYQFTKFVLIKETARDPSMWMIAITMFGLLFLSAFNSFVGRFEFTFLLALLLSFLIAQGQIEVGQKDRVWLLKGLTMIGIVIFSFNYYLDTLSGKVLIAKSENRLADVSSDLELLDSKNYSFDRIGIPIDWYRGSIALNHGVYPDAQEYLNEARIVAPYLALVYNELGVLSLVSKKDSIQQFFSSALDLSPRFEEAHFNLAVYYYYQGQTDSMSYQLNQVYSQQFLSEKENLLKLASKQE